MASCSRAGAMCAAGRTRASTLSIRAWTPPIQAPKSPSLGFTGFQGLEHFAFEDLHLLLGGLELLLAKARQLDAALVRRQRLLERQLAALHLRNDLFQLGERLLEGELCGRLHRLVRYC